MSIDDRLVTYDTMIPVVGSSCPMYTTTTTMGLMQLTTGQRTRANLQHRRLD